ncbi:MAG: hypothetical protein JNM83_13050 [Myxococcales bacterium]|nr:hypothetical protein [Myxococcales bacterium]
MRYLPCFAALLLLAACQKAAPPARLPTPQEASPEQVVVHYAPSRLRVFPAAGSDPHYVLWASERPGLPAVFRPLGTTEQRSPTGFVPRAGELTFVDGRIIEAPLPGSPAKTERELPLLVYDRDAKTATQQTVTLPGPCTLRERALLQSDGQQVFVLVRCAVEDQAMVLRLDAALAVRAARTVEGAGAVELFLHHGDSDYLLQARQVLRVPPQGLAVIGSVPPPGGDAETRELLVSGELLLVVDGAAGRVIGMDRQSMGWRLEKRFAFEGSVQRLRAAVTAKRLQLVVAERGELQKTELIGIGLSLDPGKRDSGLPQRLLLGAGPAHSDHELLPLASGEGVVLVRTHDGNTGPLVALSYLQM